MSPSFYHSPQRNDPTSGAQTGNDPFVKILNSILSGSLPTIGSSGLRRETEHLNNEDLRHLAKMLVQHIVNKDKASSISIVLASETLSNIAMRLLDAHPESGEYGDVIADVKKRLNDLSKKSTSPIEKAVVMLSKAGIIERQDSLQAIRLYMRVANSFLQLDPPQDLAALVPLGCILRCKLRNNDIKTIVTFTEQRMVPLLNSALSLDASNQRTFSSNLSFGSAITGNSFLMMAQKNDDLQMREGLLIQSRMFFERALDYSNNIGESREKFEAFYGLAKVSHEKGKTFEAIGSIERAIRILETAIPLEEARPKSYLAACELRRNLYEIRQREV